MAAGGGSTTFVVTFDPAGIGVRTATVSIANDDIDENPTAIPLQGTGVAPEIVLSSNSQMIANGDGTPSTMDGTDIGRVALLNTQVTRTFTITN